MFLFLVIAVYSNFAQAQPMVGDFVEYEVESTMSIPKRLITHRTEIVGYEATTQKFKIQTTQTSENKAPVIEISLVAEADLKAAENKIKDNVQNCQRHGGRFVVISSLIGRVRACLQPQNTPQVVSTAWYVDNPLLAMVREETYVRGAFTRYQKTNLKNYRKL